MTADRTPPTAGPHRTGLPAAFCLRCKTHLGPHGPFTAGPLSRYWHPPGQGYPPICNGPFRDLIPVGGPE